MRLVIISSTIALLLGGCQTTSSVVDQSRIHVIEPPKALFNCPEYKNTLPEGKLSNKDVAKVIENLYRNNKTCSINMKQIENFINDAKSVLESQK